MNKKTVTIILVVVAILLVGFLVFRPSNKPETQEEPTVTTPVETVEPESVNQEIIFEESPMVIEVTSADDLGFAGFEYELNAEETEEVYEDANAIDLSKYTKTENSVTYSFDGTEVIVLANAEADAEVEEVVEESTEATEEEAGEETEKLSEAVSIVAGDKIAVYLNEGVKTIVVYKA